jgi:uncharacterized protein YqjF (DUF2071 family)
MEMPWIMAMKWHDLAFLHWPVEAKCLARLLPPGLELDSFDGQAFLGLVPFRMSGIHPRCLPSVPYLSAFPEMNIRTYVRCGDFSGVWFFSLDASLRLAVEAARRAFFLPYFKAKMSCRWDHGWCYYENRRDSSTYFKGRYRPQGEPLRTVAGSLEHWLTERYWLFSQSPSGRLYKGRVRHLPWPLQRCQVEIESMDMVSWLGLKLSGEPLAHYSQLQEVVAWSITAADSGAASLRG